MTTSMKLTDEARFVVERHGGFHEGAVPYEHGRVGFAIGERVFWTDSFAFPGNSQSHLNEMKAYANQIVAQLNAGRAALAGARHE